jgi:hypothetical protein
MRVLIFEDNLIWSARLSSSATSCGAQAITARAVPDDVSPSDVAIVNLSMSANSLHELLLALQSKGVYVIAHAGHKEADLLAKGRGVGCDKVVSNKTLTFRLDELLAEAQARQN